MIDFFHQGSQVGISIHGISGFLLFVYVIAVIYLAVSTKSFMIHKLVISLRVRSQIKNLLPKWWYIEKISWTKISKDKSGYEVYVRVRSRIPTGGRRIIYGDNTCTTNDWIKVNWLGRIIKEDLTSWIESEDNLHESEIKQWSRNKSLEELGI